MTTIKNFEELEIWRLAREINNEVHTLLSKCVKDEILSKQMNRSAGSIMDNIAEGFERNGNKEFIHFLSIAKASCAELRSQLYRVLDRNFINQKTFGEIAQRTTILNQKIGKLMSYLAASHYSGTKFRRI
jgi:four helix bundle protein